ncbi:hypothetical protein F3Y22_tig00004355pilonHSYRG00105 [Hibiscus syriacus]|uniref:Reverse transcriptase zinc-binding domain-containing protein n=1 Tax=Hibiscus syriacus TaxID=106335 RepID=A0A6A3CLL0_HIBSY|nr:hypothetical protein F3Y22_tig00004355pilonHSYRG00105 [Hibiscus syriacus]
MLRDSNNAWVSDPSSLKLMVQDYFKYLISIDFNHRMPLPTLNCPTIPLDVSQTLIVEIKEEEVHRALFMMKSWKVSGDDGVHAGVYQEFWGPLLVDLVTPFQVSFIPGRQVADNIFLAQEVNENLSWMWKLPIPARWKTFVWVLKNGPRPRFRPRYSGFAAVRVTRDGRNSVCDSRNSARDGGNHDNLNIAKHSQESVWRLWTVRCKRIFEPDDNDYDDIRLWLNIIPTTNDILLAYKEPSLKPNTHIQVAWPPPKNGKLKLNTDSASQGNLGISGAGGILRNTFSE